MKKVSRTFFIALKVICLLQVTFGATNCFSQNFLWAKSAGGTYYNDGKSVSTDANGNVFVTGYFVSPTITFGTITLTNADNTNSSADLFIAKYDASGNVLWAKSIGENSCDEKGYCCSADANGNVFITGIFACPTVTFGTTILTNVNPGYTDVFIAKYDAAGNALWARSAGGTYSDDGMSVSTDPNGNVFMTGDFQVSINFGTLTLTNAGNYGFFIAKYDASGNLLWADSAGGSSADVGYSVSSDSNGNVFATGFFQSNLITFGTTTLSNAGNGDMFIVKYDAGGNVLWANSVGGGYSDLGYSVSSDFSGNVFVTGFFRSPTIIFGTTVLTNQDNTGNSQDIFIAKYNAAGNLLWAKSAGGSASDAGSCISIDANGNVFMAGRFQSPTIIFGTTTLTNADITGYTQDIFIVKYDASGNMLWAKSAGGTSDDDGKSVSTDMNGNVFMTGMFQSPAITFGTTTLTNIGAASVYTVKFGTVSGVESFGGSGAISIFPNPSNGKFQLDFGDNQFTRREIEIYNLLGEKVYQSANGILQTTNEIDISCQPGGIYFYHVTEKQKVISSGKIIVQ
jgi:hypothetical protein